MQGLRRSYSCEDVTQPDTTPIRKTQSEGDLAGAMQRALNITDPRATALLDVVTPPGPLIADFRGFNTGATADPERRMQGSEYYTGLLNADEWQLFYETLEDLRAKPDLDEQEGFMLKALNWYLAAIEHGSIYDASIALEQSNVRMHMTISCYVFCNLLGRGGIRAATHMFIDLNRFVEPTTPEEVERSKREMRSKFTPLEWSIIQHNKEELECRDLTRNPHGRAVLEAINHLMDICDQGSMRSVCEVTGLTPEVIVNQIDTLVLNIVLGRPAGTPAE